MSRATQSIFGLAGVVLPFAGAAAPAGWLLCHGQAVSRTEYAHLFSIIGIAFGAGNGTTTFNVPDLRGEFIRGLDSGAGIDPSRALGSKQGDLVKMHDHQISSNAYYSTNQTFPAGNYAGVFQLPGVEMRTAQSGGNENRPRNIALNHIIKT